MKCEGVTRKIIGCCFRVHRAIGPGFQEKVYARALKWALQQVELHYEIERKFSLEFDGESIGDFRADLVVENDVLVELKAIVGRMPKVHTAQVVSYLKASKLPVGLLVNFGNRSCDVKRFDL